MMAVTPLCDGNGRVTAIRFRSTPPGIEDTARSVTTPPMFTHYYYYYYYYY